MTTMRSAVLAMVLVGAALCPYVWAQDADQSDLAQDLTNPVADLLTIPIQLNYDQNFGPADDGWKLQANYVLPKP